MVRKRSVVLGFFFGGAVLALGVGLIFFKDPVWQLFEAFYGLLGIQSERTRLWEMFVSTVGLFIATIGLFLIWAVWKRWRSEVTKENGLE